MKTIAVLAMALTLTSCNDGSGQVASGGLDSLVASLDPGMQPEGIVARRLLSGDAVIAPWNSTFSPDGRYRLTIDWSTRGSLSIQDVETGELRVLVPAVPIGNDPRDHYEYAQYGRFSRDGRTVVYSWYRELPPSEAGADGQGRYELRTVPVDGGEPRTLVDPFATGWNAVDPMDWSADGKRIVARARGPESVELIVVSVEDGSIRPMRQFEPRSRPDAFFSPDGRYVAYSAPSASRQDFDLFIFDLSSGRDVGLFEQASDDNVAGWSRDGAYLYFWSDQAGSSIWAFPVREGNRAGDPVLIRRDVQGFLGGEVTNGRLLYHSVAETKRVYTMAIEMASGRILSEPVPVPGTGLHSGPEWSPDGERLAYVRGTLSAGAGQGSASSSGSFSNSTSVVVRSSEGEDVREFPLPAPFQDGVAKRWTPDGGKLFVPANGADRRVLTLDLADGQFSIGPVSPVNPARPLSADGNIVYQPGRAIDLRTGEARAFVTGVDLEASNGRYPGTPCRIGGSVALSPDDRTLAFASNPVGEGEFCVGTIPINGGPATIVYRNPDLQDPAIAWSADGRDLLFTLEAGGPAREMWTIPAAGGTARKLFTFDGIEAISVNPDNRRIAFLAGVYRYEVWVMEGLDELVASH